MIINIGGFCYFMPMNYRTSVLNDVTKTRCPSPVVKLAAALKYSGSVSKSVLLISMTQMSVLHGDLKLSYM